MHFVLYLSVPNRYEAEAPGIPPQPHLALFSWQTVHARILHRFQRSHSPHRSFLMPLLFFVTRKVTSFSEGKKKDSRARRIT